MSLVLAWGGGIWLGVVLGSIETAPQVDDPSLKEPHEQRQALLMPKVGRTDHVNPPAGIFLAGSQRSQESDLNPQTSNPSEGHTPRKHGRSVRRGTRKAQGGQKQKTKYRG